MSIIRIILRRNFKYSLLYDRPHNLHTNSYCKNGSNSYILSNMPCKYLDNMQIRKIGMSIIFYQDIVIKTPPFAESVSEGDIRWDKSVGESVQIDEVIGEIETDKTAIPIHASCAGTISALLVADGDKVVANQELAKISPGDVSKNVKVEDKPQKKTVPETVTVEKVIEMKQQPQTSALKHDKLIKEVQPPMQLKMSLPEEAGVKFISGTRGEQRVKMNRMRLRIAQRLKDAQNTCAMLTTFNECDMSSVIELRQKYKDQFQKKHGVKLGFMSAFVRASALALHDQPVVNAVIDGTDILYRDYVDISVAVSTPRGLVVPVLRDAHNMNFAQIEKTIFELGEKARLGQLAIEDMDGGTFTISNGGVFGSLMGTPIINPPQSAILGIHATQQRPIAIDGRVEIRPMMYLALTYDHRLVDGREAVTFLKRIKAFIEDPRSPLLEL